MGPPSYRRSVVDRNVVMRRIPVFLLNYEILYVRYYTERVTSKFYYWPPTNRETDSSVIPCYLKMFLHCHKLSHCQYLHTMPYLVLCFDITLGSDEHVHDLRVATRGGPVYRRTAVL